MTIFYIFSGTIAYLFLSYGQVTALHFDSEIERFIYGGKESELHLQVLPDGKTLVLKPKAKALTANLLIFTAKEKYNFHLRIKSPAHELVEIKTATNNLSYKLIRREPAFDLLEGASSLLLKNKQASPIVVNAQTISHFAYLSKGAPLFIGHEQIYP